MSLGKFHASRLLFLADRHALVAAILKRTALGHIERTWNLAAKKLNVRLALGLQRKDRLHQGLRIGMFRLGQILCATSDF